MLWDSGFDEISDIDDRIPAQRVALAHRSLGLATPRESRTLAYWERALGISRAELVGVLAELGVNVSAGSRVLPKGALSKLRRATSARQVVDVPVAQHDGPATATAASPSLDPFVWETIGSPRDCVLLEVEDVCRIHKALEEEFAGTPDPVSPPGVRDIALLESAVGRAATSLGDQAKYPTAEMAAAALLHSLTHNHPFFNGNKRTALVAMLVSLDRNGLLLTSDQQALFRYVLRVAQHKVAPAGADLLADREVLAISQWICDYSRPIAKGERPIKWRELRRNLVRLGCVIEGPIPGNKVKIKRTVTSRGFFGRPRESELTFTAWYGGEGREVRMDHVHSMRRALQLDDEAGYDSDHFYGSDPREPDELIAQYRNILKRLARL